MSLREPPTSKASPAWYITDFRSARISTIAAMIHRIYLSDKDCAVFLVKFGPEGIDYEDFVLPASTADISNWRRSPSRFPKL